MNRLNLLRRIAVIHAIKCKRTTSEQVANSSFEKVTELRTRINNSTEEEQDALLAEIHQWAGSNPIATDNEINNLL
jgi:hypothetical protein